MHRCDRLSEGDSCSAAGHVRKEAFNGVVEGLTRPFAVAFLGHGMNTAGEPECNFRVTHLRSGRSWWARQALSDWQRLEAQVKEEALIVRREETRVNDVQRQAATNCFADAAATRMAVRRRVPAAFPPLRKPGGGGSSSSTAGSSRRSKAGATSSPSCAQRLLEDLQAKLAEMLREEEFWDSVSMQRFLGVRPPDMPRSCRIKRLEVGNAEAVVELEIMPQDASDGCAASYPEIGGGAAEFAAPATHFAAAISQVDFVSMGNLQEEVLTQISMRVALSAEPTIIEVGGLRAGVMYDIEVNALNAVGESEGIHLRIIPPEPHPSLAPEPESAALLPLPPGPVNAAPTSSAVTAAPPSSIATEDLVESRDTSTTEASLPLTATSAEQDAAPLEPSDHSDMSRAALQDVPLAADHAKEPRRCEGSGANTVDDSDRAPGLEDSCTEDHSGGTRVKFDCSHCVEDPTMVEAFVAAASETCVGAVETAGLTAEGTPKKDAVTAMPAAVLVPSPVTLEPLPEHANGEQMGEADASTSTSATSAKQCSAAAAVLFGAGPTLHVQATHSTPGRNAEAGSDALASGSEAIALDTEVPSPRIRPMGPRVSDPEALIAMPLASATGPAVECSMPKAVAVSDESPKQRTSTEGNLVEAGISTFSDEAASESTPAAPAAASAAGAAAASPAPAAPATSGPSVCAHASAPAPSSAELLAAAARSRASSKSVPADLAAAPAVSQNEVCNIATPAEAMAERSLISCGPGDALDRGLPHPEGGDNAGTPARNPQDGSHPCCEMPVVAATPGKPSAKAAAKVPPLSGESEIKPAATQRKLQNVAAPPPPVPPNCVRVSGFVLRRQQLPDVAGANDPKVMETLVEQVRRRCARIVAEEGGDPSTFTTQKALRLLMGSDLDVDVALKKLRSMAKWRTSHSLDQVHVELVTQLATSNVPPALARQVEVNKLFPVNPCSVMTSDGCPLTVWKVGKAHASAVSKVSTADIETWSRTFFEYVDLWLTEQSELTGRLAGHIQVFDLSGLSFFQVANSALVDKLKAALSAGGNYAESVSHIFVVNSSSAFSMAWKVVKTLITPRTASKIVVASDVPEELLKLVGAQGAQRLQAILSNAKVGEAGYGQQRPPEVVVEHMLSSVGAR